MISKPRGDFISNRAWLEDITGEEEIILKSVSALEYLKLFVGYMGEKEIDVYAKKRGGYENINYNIVNTFDGIDYIKNRNVLCSSVTQAVNDMLEDYDNADEQALASADNF